MSRRRRLPGRDEPSGTEAAQQTAFLDLASAQMHTWQREALDRLVEAVEQSFYEKQAASERRDWCNPIPAETKVESAQDYLKAFHDKSTMEITTYLGCYLKTKPCDLDYVDWKRLFPDEIRHVVSSLLVYKRCFLDGDGEVVVLICFTC
jgi:hypothetical protein